MVDEPIEGRTFRLLQERTGKHFCTLCLMRITWEEFNDNDSLCDDCAEREAHPLMVKD